MLFSSGSDRCSCLVVSMRPRWARPIRRRPRLRLQRLRRQLQWQRPCLRCRLQLLAAAQTAAPMRIVMQWIRTAVVASVCRCQRRLAHRSAMPIKCSVLRRPVGGSKPCAKREAARWRVARTCDRCGRWAPRAVRDAGLQVRGTFGCDCRLAAAWRLLLRPTQPLRSARLWLDAIEWRTIPRVAACVLGQWAGRTRMKIPTRRFRWRRILRARVRIVTRRFSRVRILRA
jgi:hypothetical protein